MTPSRASQALSDGDRFRQQAWDHACLLPGDDLPDDSSQGEEDVEDFDPAAADFDDLEPLEEDDETEPEHGDFWFEADDVEE
jgi:hypothetical protein